MLADFYEKHDIPEKDRIPLEKNILFVVPSKDFDLKPTLSTLGLSKHEVSVTYPKTGVDMLAEILLAKPILVVQVGQQFSKKFRFIRDENDIDDVLVEAVRGCISDYFVALHHHDEFSIKDGLGTVEQLVKLLKAQRRSFCCVTNHGGVGGWIKQYNACRKAGIKAVFGCEIYRSDYRGDDMEEKKKHRSANHLLLIARTMEGFENIIKIHNDAQINGFYYTPRVNREALEKWGKGIVGSSACLASDIPQFLLNGEKDKAIEAYQFYSRVFDRFYIELQLIEYGVQQDMNRLLIQFAREVGAPLLVTYDSHYLEPEHAETHDVLMCVRQHKTLSDEEGDESADVWNFDVRNLYYRNLEQIIELFENGFVEKDGTVRPPFKDDIFTEDVLWEALHNTRNLAIEAEDIKLDSTIKLPKLYENGEDILGEKVNIGFIARGLDKKENIQEYLDRARYEFDVITKLGWTDYFLIVEEIVSYSKSKFGEFSVGYGRGCFHPSMRVTMANGFPKFIGDVKKGDVVISHDGSPCGVTNTLQYDVSEELIEIETDDGRIIVCTKDHRILVKSGSKTLWKKASDLRDGDDLVTV